MRTSKRRRRVQARAQFRNPAKMPSGLAAAICQLLIATVLAAVINWAGADRVGNGVLVGALVWIGFAAPIVGITLMFELRSIAHHAITGGHTLIALVVMGGIIGAIS